MKTSISRCLLLISLLFSINGKAQDGFLDSLKDVCQIAPKDTNLVKNLNDLSIEYLNLGEDDSSFRYASFALLLGKSLHFKTGQALSHNILANLYFFEGNYPKSLENNLAALRIRESLRDLKAVANSYNNIGNVYHSLGDSTQALSYHFTALKIRKHLKDSVNISFSYNNIGNVYQKSKNFKKALEFHLEALKIKEVFGDSTEICLSLNNIGIVYTEIKNYDEALKYQFEALKIAEALEDPYNLDIVYVNLCFTFVRQNNMEQAEFYGLKALELARELEDVETIVQATNSLSIVYQKTGRFEQALNFYEEHIGLRDSLFSEENIEKTIQTQLQFDFEKKALATKLAHENKEALTQAENDKQRYILILISFLLLVLIIFLIFTYRNYLAKQRSNQIIIQQKTEAEKQKSIIQEKNKDITGSIKYAKRIQEAILPSHETITTIIEDYFILYSPKDIVSGDFYWVSDAVTKYQEKFVMAAVADCTGHGVPGALMSIIGNNFLRICEREPSVNRPSEALDFINVGISRTLRQEYSKSSIQDGMDMVFIAIDYHAMNLHFAGAKNSIYVVRNGELTEYKGDKHPIGAFVGEEMKKFTNHTISIQKGDCIYLFSDGYADQFGGEHGKKFMYSRFKQLLATNSYLPMNEQRKKLIDAFENWKGTTEQVDDVCVFGIRI